MNGFKINFCLSLVLRIRCPSDLAVWQPCAYSFADLHLVIGAKKLSLSLNLAEFSICLDRVLSRSLAIAVSYVIVRKTLSKVGLRSTSTTTTTNSN